MKSRNSPADSFEIVEESNATSSTGNISNQSMLVKGKAPIKKKIINKGGRPRSIVWEHFTKDLPDRFGYYRAICQYCNQHWSRRKLTVMKSHLALHCKKVPDDINNLFLRLIAEKAEKLVDEDNIDDNIDDNILLTINKKHKYISKQATLDSSFKSTESVNKDQHALVTVKITKALTNQQNLTLALDGCLTSTNNSLYDYIIATPERKEYLITIEDYSTNSQTGIYMTDKISTIIEKIGSSKVTALVTDNDENVRVARQIIHETYSQIMNIRCIAHALNLILTDLVKLELIKKTLTNASIIISFFKTSYTAGHLL
ncbi:10524_t:CDS:2 [Ambispora gerdemannii]|uniref:10524_t:CDS:1 n=1 Tax=Ambispora gerdemannii TaxID=144530 RepID=A0A9N9D0Y2_9GLOM|nr:10524_t:CDS:2 [Ambispora gerdemannii]